MQKSRAIMQLSCLKNMCQKKSKPINFTLWILVMNVEKTNFNSYLRNKFHFSGYERKGLSAK